MVSLCSYFIYSKDKGIKNLRLNVSHYVAISTCSYLTGLVLNLSKQMLFLRNLTPMMHENLPFCEWCQESTSSDGMLAL
jgi:hypothetical protein